MSAEVATETPVAPVVETTPAVTEPVEAPKVEETKPADETPATTEAVVESATEETKAVDPKESGYLHYHAPGNFLK
jgi:hypothetical protein